jgi:hypothetical protein
LPEGEELAPQSGRLKDEGDDFFSYMNETACRWLSRAHLRFVALAFSWSYSS